MPQNNNTIIGDFLLRNTNDAQQLGLTSTMTGLSAGMQNIFDPVNGDIYNHFVDWLVKVPAMQYTRQTAFENQLKGFIKKVTYGNSVFENQVGWVKEHSYDIKDSKLLKMYYPEGGQAYHEQNRQGVFPMSVSRDDLRTAFQDEMGLNQLISQITQAPINSDEYSTYSYMKQLIAVYDDASPIYTVHYDEEPATVDAARLLLADMVGWTKKIGYPSAAWNATRLGEHTVATFDRPENMVLMVTPKLYGYLKVLGFGMLFNMNEADTPYRVVVMDEFPIPNVFAILCSEGWFQCYDTEYAMMSFFDVDTLTTQYRLHHWQILSTSPFAPILCFGTRAATEPHIAIMTPTGVTIAPATGGTIDIGGTLQLEVDFDGSTTDEAVEVKPDAVTWSVAGETSDGEALHLNSRTYIDSDYVLHLQRTNIESGSKLSVTGTTVWTNPSGETTHYTKTVEITVN